MHMQQPLKRQAVGLTAHHADVISRGAGNWEVGKPEAWKPGTNMPGSPES